MKPLKFYLITDTHYFKNSLGAYGKEYEEFMEGEQKCFAETESINEAVFKYLETANEADILLIAGDLTFWGEKECHKDFSKLLHDFKEKSGKKIYVVTAGHDFNNNAFGFNENGRFRIETAEFSDLYDLYKDFGYSDAIAFNKEHLSYVSELSEDVRLLVISNDIADKKHITYDDKFLTWIAEQAQKAKADGKMMIAMEHYPVLPGQPVLALIEDAWQAESKKLVETLADNGVHLIFTGHMHNQSINVTKTEKGNLFYDVCTGSVIGWPSFIRLVTIEDENTVDIKSIQTPEFEWDKNGLTSKEYLIAQFEKMIRTLIIAMRDNPQRFMRKINLEPSPSKEKIFRFIGKKLNKMTLGQFAHLLLTSADKEIKNDSFVEFAVNLVRSIFEGNQPYVEGTPEGDLLLKVFKRLKPFFKNMKDSQGNHIDFYETMKHTAGNYGIDDYNATLKLTE